MRSGVSQREARFYQTGKTAYVDASKRREIRRFEEIKGFLSAGKAGELRRE